MNQINAKPNLLKQINISLIRKAILAKGTVTRAEIAKETSISSTTVRSLLVEMQENDEIYSKGYDESSGGRKAERYSINPNRYFGAVICIMNNQLRAILVNLNGEIIEINKFNLESDNYDELIFSFLDKLLAQREIKAIGIGIPGIVEGNSYWKKHLGSDELYKVDIGDKISNKYGIPVILENDINATAIGFGRCYHKSFPNENQSQINMAYLHFEVGCVSAGFLVGGRIIHGHNHFAGELGLIPINDGKLLSSALQEPMDDLQYINWIVQILSWICGILNPQYIALGGPAMRESCISDIGDSLFAMLPKNMFAEILYSPDVWHDYYDGMAHLTVERIFDDFQFVNDI